MSEVRQPLEERSAEKNTGWAGQMLLCGACQLLFMCSSTGRDIVQVMNGEFG